ncbi:hypothetical protein [Emticicia sp. TH156]|uniref:hypothetical protein n=1 Tax=Emticicia sp. TH156 TaxID=2067454 RepID=UPI0013043049|nr:hypothetical protein [Emticicia sp. TH156]
MRRAGVNIKDHRPGRDDGLSDKPVRMVCLHLLPFAEMKVLAGLSAYGFQQVRR